MFSEEEIKNEVDAMEKLCRGLHPNVIEIFQHGRIYDSAFYYIDMELCDCNLDEYIYGRKTVPSLLDWSLAVDNGEGPFLTCYIMSQIISGLKFIHAHDEVHRDFNPQNSITALVQ